MTRGNLGVCIMGTRGPAWRLDRYDNVVNNRGRVPNHSLNGQTSFLGKS